MRSAKYLHVRVQSKQLRQLYYMIPHIIHIQILSFKPRFLHSRKHAISVGCVPTNNAFATCSHDSSPTRVIFFYLYELFLTTVAVRNKLSLPLYGSCANHCRVKVLFSRYFKHLFCKQLRCVRLNICTYAFRARNCVNYITWYHI